MGTMHDGHHGMTPWKQLPKYDTYKSPYGPNYKIARNFHGIDMFRATRLYVTHEASNNENKDKKKMEKKKKKKSTIQDANLLITAV